VYYEHFGLSGAPFSARFSATPLFLGAGHREALAALEWGLCEPSGFTLLVGDFGTGKTTLILSLLERRLESVHAAWIADPKLSFPEMLQVIATQLHLQAQPADRFHLLTALDKFVDELKPEESVALIFDEVQGLSDETLEELRLLRSIRSARETRLQIILVGQSGFVERLNQLRNRQLNQRIGARAALPALKADEVREYVDYRLRGFGGTVDKLFTPGAIKELNRNCEGIPRKINLLCDNALLGAYAQGARQVGTGHMRVAVRDYDNLLWSANGHARWSGIQKTITQLGGMNLAGVAAVCLVVLLGLALSYHLDPQAFGSFQPARQLKPARLAAHSDQLHPRAVDAQRDTVEKRQASATSMISGAPKNSGAVKVVATASGTSPAAAPLVPVNQPDGVKGERPPASAAGALAESTPPPGSDDEKRAGLPQHVEASSNHADSGEATVVVKKGDSLSKIAAAYFGSGREEQVNLLVQANPQITDADHIFPGQIIHIQKARTEP
jgi:type II secretory pathway predicted ATPase ExeA